MPVGRASSRAGSSGASPHQRVLRPRRLTQRRQEAKAKPMERGCGRRLSRSEFQVAGGCGWGFAPRRAPGKSSEAATKFGNANPRRGAEAGTHTELRRFTGRIAGHAFGGFCGFAPLQCSLPISSRLAKILARGFCFLSPRRRSGERTEERGNPRQTHLLSPPLSSIRWRRGSGFGCVSAPSRFCVNSVVFLSFKQCHHPDKRDFGGKRITVFENSAEVAARQHRPTKPARDVLPRVLCL
jgi:hypothetical protein